MILWLLFVVAFPDEEHEAHVALGEKEYVGERGDGEEDDTGLVVMDVTVGVMVYCMYFMAVAKSIIPHMPKVICDILVRKTLFCPKFLSILVPE